MWPAFRDAGKQLLAAGKCNRVLVAAVRNAPYPEPGPVSLLTEQPALTWAAADAAIVKSGTATLEGALAQVPMVVAYRVAAVTGFLVRRMGIKVEHASLVNLLVGHAVVPELMQEDCTADRVAAAADELFRSEEAREVQREGFREVIAILGEADPAPSERAAKVVLDSIRAQKAVDEAIGLS